MTVRRPPPGVQLATGHVRVDAARAIAKLREYRLAEPRAWILEAVRAAVASGATRIALDGDADDVRLVWDGPAWPADVLPDLFDELVSPEASRDVYHRRLLAGAVNSALGLEPSWVDVVAVQGGKAARVRFTPATVTPGEDGEAPLRHLDAEAIAVPDGAPAEGMCVQLRRRAGLDTLGRFLVGGEAPELALARWACRDITVPMVIAGLAVGRGEHGDDLLRLPLGEDLDGFVALAHPLLLRGHTSVPALDVAELGVRVVRQRWRPPALDGHCDDKRGTLPLRLVIDGPRMPTNASRSQVRTDDHPVAAALRRGDAQLAAMAETIAARLGALADDVARTAAFAESRSEPATLRAAVLGLLAPAIAGDDWSGDATTLRGPLATLARLPLLRNAVGVWRAPVEYWRGPAYRGDRALPRELSPWLGSMPWIPPGDAAERLLGARPDAREARRVVKSAYRRLRARTTFLAKPAQEARVERRAASRVRARLGAVLAGLAPAEAFAGLDGEVCVANAPGPGRLTLLFDGRPLATAGLDTPLAIEAVVSGARLVPDVHYRGVAVDGEFRRAERAARVAAIRAIEALAGGEARPGVEISAPRRSDEDGQLFRIALAMAAADGIHLDDDSPLALAHVFMSPDGVTHTLAQLRREHVIAVAARASGVVPPHGRLLLVVTPAEQRLLSRLLGPGTAIVPYGPEHAATALDPGLALARAIAARTGAVTLVRREGVLAGAIGFEPAGASSTLARHHRGVRVEVVARQPAFVACAIAIDSEALVPAEDWGSVRDDGGIGEADLAAWEQELVRATARVVLGDSEPDLVIPRRPIRVDDPSGQALCRALAAHDARSLLGEELAGRMRASHLWPVLRGDGPRSIDELCAAWGDDLPSIDPAFFAEAATLEGWHPIVASDVVRGAIASLSGRNVVDVTGEIADRKRAAHRQRKLAEHRQRPKEAMELPDEQAPIRLDVVERGVRGVVGLGEGTLLEAVVLVEGRRFARIVSSPDLPLRGVVELPVDAVNLEHGEVGALAGAQVVAAIRAAAGPWIAHVAANSPEKLADDAAARLLLARWLEAHDDGGEPGAERRHVLEALRTARAWPTITGARASLAAAAHGPTVPTAAWSGEWLAGDPADPLDGPVLAVPVGKEGDALRAILDAIGPWPTDDVTAQVRRLQAQRRVARGGVPSPTVAGAARELTRRLDELDVHHTLGAGEIALADAAGSTLLLHFEGEYRLSVPLDVGPGVHVAIEAPDLVDAAAQPGGIAAAHREQLARQVRELALAFVTQLAIATGHGAPLPGWARRRLATAVLAQHLEPERVAALPLFTTSTGVLISWNDVRAQESLLGDVWYVGDFSAAVPLDSRREVLVLDERDATLASRFSGVTFVDARRELALDAQARANRERPPLTRLELPPHVRGSAMAVVELVTAVSRRRGFVAPLRPGAIEARGLHASRELVPFERAGDPCAWPTYAIVEDPDLRGDRTWRRAVEDDVFRSLADDVRATSEAAIRSWLAAPADALASELVDAWQSDRLSSLWDDSMVRGVLWIDPIARDVRAPGQITVATPHGDLAIDAPPEAPLWGTLYTAPEPRGLVSAVATLCRARYDALARRAGVWREPERPAEVDAQGVYGGARSATRRGSGGYVEPEVSAFPDPPPPSADAWLPEPRPRAEPPAQRLQPLVDAVRARLDEGSPIGLGVALRIDASRAAPPIHVSAGKLVFAGAAPLLVAIHEGREDDAPWASAAIDALAAHCMTLINAALTPVDDRHERAALLRWLASP